MQVFVRECPEFEKLSSAFGVYCIQIQIDAPQSGAKKKGLFALLGHILAPQGALRSDFSDLSEAWGQILAPSAPTKSKILAARRQGG